MNPNPDPTDALEIDPALALERQHGGALLLDVREDDERAGGHEPCFGALPARILASDRVEHLSESRTGVRRATQHAAALAPSDRRA